MDWKRLFLSFEGRIGQRDFWIGFLIVTVASIVLGALPCIGQLIGLLLLWSQLCLYAKRLHDLGRSALVMLLPAAISFVCVILAVVSGGRAFLELASASSSHAAQRAGWAGLGASMVLFCIALGVGLLFLLWVGLSRGEPGSNRFGSPPEPLIR